jgi:hypothetical protein
MLPPCYHMLTTPLFQLRLHDLHNRVLPNCCGRARSPCFRHACRGCPSREFHRDSEFLQFCMMAAHTQQALFPCLVFLLAGQPNLSSLRAPPFHWPCTAMAATAAVLFPRTAGNAKGAKRD